MGLARFPRGDVTRTRSISVRITGGHRVAPSFLPVALANCCLVDGFDGCDLCRTGDRRLGNAVATVTAGGKALALAPLAPYHSGHLSGSFNSATTEHRHCRYSRPFRQLGPFRAPTGRLVGGRPDTGVGLGGQPHSSPASLGAIATSEPECCPFYGSGTGLLDGLDGGAEILALKTFWRTNQAQTQREWV